MVRRLGWASSFINLAELGQWTTENRLWSDWDCNEVSGRSQWQGLQEVTSTFSDGPSFPSSRFLLPLPGLQWPLGLESSLGDSQYIVP